MIEQKQDEGMSERERDIRQQFAGVEIADKEYLISVIDRLRAANAALTKEQDSIKADCEVHKLCGEAQRVLKDLNISRWTQAQEQLASIETRLIEITGEQCGISDNLDLARTLGRERDEARAILGLPVGMRIAWLTSLGYRQSPMLAHLAPLEECERPSAQAPDPQFTDRERLDWLVKCESIGFASGDREPDSWIPGRRLRKSIDAAMLSAGLRPKQLRKAKETA